MPNPTTVPATTQPTTPPASANAAPGQVTPTVPSGATPPVTTPAQEPKPAFPPTMVPSYRVKEEADKRRAAEAELARIKSQSAQPGTPPAPTSTPASAIPPELAVTRMLEKGNLDPNNAQNRAAAYEMLEQAKAIYQPPAQTTPAPATPPTVTGNESIAELKQKFEQFEAQVQQERIAARVKNIETSLVQEFKLDASKVGKFVIEQAGKELAQYLPNIPNDYTVEEKWNFAHAYMRDRVPKIKAEFDAIIHDEAQRELRENGANYNTSPQIPGMPGAVTQVESPDPDRVLWKDHKMSDSEYFARQRAKAWDTMRKQ